MVPGEGENQLEFFDLANQPAARLRRESLGRFLVHLRHDQAILLSIAALLGLTVIFAFGVERGKQLVRSEALQLAKRMQLAGETASGRKAQAKEKAAKEPVEEKAVPKQSVKQKIKVADKAGSVKSRYAVQVVTYSRPTLAKQELDRLKARGEPAFIIIREGMTVVFVGPFPSKGNASEKLANLKSQYQGCFIKTL